MTHTAPKRPRVDPTPHSGPLWRFWSRFGGFFSPPAGRHFWRKITKRVTYSADATVPPVPPGGSERGRRDGEGGLYGCRAAYSLAGTWGHSIRRARSLAAFARSKINAASSVGFFVWRILSSRCEATILRCARRPRHGMLTDAELDRDEPSPF